MLEKTITQKLDEWIEAEKNGEPFPIPLAEAYPMAGYKTDRYAKKKFPSNGQDLYAIRLEKKIAGRGRPQENYYLSCTGLKHLCLMADTPEGNSIRDYFIQAEEKWKMVEVQHPAIAEEITLQQLRNESLRLELQRHQAELELTQFRHSIVTTCPEPTQKKILGYNEVHTVEYRDRIITSTGEVLREGDTCNKTELCRRYGLMTKNGKPDYKKLNALLAQLDIPNECWEEVPSVRNNTEFKAAYLDTLDELIENADSRQLWIGESTILQ